MADILAEFFRTNVHQGRRYRDFQEIVSGDFPRKIGLLWMYHGVPYRAWLKRVMDYNDDWTSLTLGHSSLIDRKSIFNSCVGVLGDDVLDICHDGQYVVIVPRMRLRLRFRPSFPSEDAFEDANNI